VRQSKEPSVPPHNPGLRDLIENKNCWSSGSNANGAKQSLRDWHERGYLPHRNKRGLIQFVTFRLADSFPRSLRSEWEHFLKLEDNRERRQKLENYLDQGRGNLYLSRPKIAGIVEDTLRLFHGDRYDLHAWTIMPNHIHVLFKPRTVLMSEIVCSWKKHTGRIANKILNRTGSFWSPDYFDTFIRDAEHYQKTIRYIENNATKARLILDPKDWQWSSARFRDKYGNLRL
jgi:REP element-mobilizing transposase RayT